MEWIDCGDDFMPADVIRWRESVWEKRGRKRGKNAVRLGDRLVVAEVIQEDGKTGLVTLLVRASSVLSDNSGRGKVQPLSVGETVQRKRETLRKGASARMPWSDETARAQLEVERRSRSPAPPSQH